MGNLPPKESTHHLFTIESQKTIEIDQIHQTIVIVILIGFKEMLQIIRGRQTQVPQ